MPDIAFSPHNFKILPANHMEFFWVSYLTQFFLEIGRNYVSIIITIISNITVLVSHNVICFRYFIPMSHGVSKNAPPILSPIPPTRFSPELFVILQKILYQPFFALSDYWKK